MPTRRLIATKSYRYATRRLQAGEEFEASDMHARILVASRKAAYAPDQAAQPQQQVQPEPEPVPVQEMAAAAAETEAEIDLPLLDPRNIDSLRAQAARLGVTVDGRWGIARLQHEIMQAQRG
jgi:hypothetical protein